MATQKIQKYLPFDITTLANYKAMYQGIESALTTLGWVRVDTVETDAGAVNWTNVVSVPVPVVGAGSGSSFPSLNAGNWRGAFVGGTAYAVDDVVTSGGLTYMCYAVTTLATGVTVKRQTAVSFTPSTVTGATTTTFVVNCASTIGAGGTNTYQNWVFTLAGMLNTQNNGTFICTASTATSLTLSSAIGLNETCPGGATGVSSANSTNYAFSSQAGFTLVVTNGLQGHSIAFSNWLNAGNNNTFTVTASAGGGTSNCVIGVTNSSGANESTSGGTITESTAPVSDTAHWSSNNYAIWKSTGPCSTTNPIYLKLGYGIFVNTSTRHGLQFSVGTGQVNGILTGNVFNSATPLTMCSTTGAVNGGSTAFECDFCGNADRLSCLLWRGVDNQMSVLCIDRAHDGFGADLDAYTVVMYAGYTATSASAYYQLLFKPGAGNVFPASPNTKWPCINDNQASGLLNGAVPPFLCFPLPGYMANPCLGAIAAHSGDINEGGLINVTMYGTVHTFLLTKTAGCAATLAGSGAAGIEWEIF